MDEHEEYTLMLMMEALDGELSAEGRDELQSHLRVRPELEQEWQALQAIDSLFKATPALSPAADFTQRTIARLPNRTARLWFVGIIYFILFVSGTVPVLAVGWLLLLYGPAVFQPGLLGNLAESVGAILGIVGVLTNALITGLGDFIGQQPAILGVLLVMAGVVSLWSGVYRQLVSQPTVVNQPVLRGGQ